MLNICVVDENAEARNLLVKEINTLLQGDYPELDLLPRIAVKPVAIQELRFNQSPDICILGAALVAREITEVGKIKKLLPNTALIVKADSSLLSLSIVEQLARFGVDDVISDNIDPREFFRKIVLLSRRAGQKASGKLLVVDSGKGGVGVTSVVAGLAELLFEKEKSVVVIDMDFETQDLSRFLQARPFVNESLQLLFDQTRPVTEEFVKQSLVPVWDSEENFFCMPPILESEDLYDSRSAYSRTLVSVLEVLDAMYDVIIVDVGSARGAMLKTLYRVADHVIFLINNDPATLYASSDRLAKARSWMAPASELHVFENQIVKHGLSLSVLRQEFGRATKIKDNEWLEKGISFCPRAARWPGSGTTMYSLGKSNLKSVLNLLAARCALIPEVESLSFSRALKSRTKKIKFGRESDLASKSQEQKNDLLKLPNQMEHDAFQSEAREVSADENLIDSVEIIENNMERDSSEDLQDVITSAVAEHGNVSRAAGVE